jgi:RNA polymerase sigma-70 factor, ECF subfamily
VRAASNRVERLRMSPTHSDWALSRRILNGDEAAFRALFDDMFPRLYRFALVRLDGDPEQARELVQLTFCRAFERLDSYRGESSLFGWLCQICRNAIADLGRGRVRESRHLTLPEDDGTLEEILESLAAPPDDEPECRVWRSELVRLIQAALDCLPGHYGDVLEWKYVDDLSVKEIAERLAIGPKAAESYLTRARGAFRQAITAIGGSIDMTALSREDAK